MEKLVALCKEKYNPSTWHEKSKEAFEELFELRYPGKAKITLQFRTPKMGDDSVAFSAIIHSNNPNSGAYSGMSFVLFPISDGPPLIALVIGTLGLSPDDGILGKPGHARKTNAITKWLNSEFAIDRSVGWSKQDPTRKDLDIPLNVANTFSDYSSIFERYGPEIYSFVVGNEKVLESALKAYLDLFLEERGVTVRSKLEDDKNRIKERYFKYIFPDTTVESIVELLKTRKYAIVQGPPGTGKTRLGLELLKNTYQGKGFTIQFHANTTYENFVGGLFPTISNEAMGFTFKPKAGDFIKAVRLASESKESHLLVIDEINRADLSKVLGEAIYCLEPFDSGREINLPFSFDEIGGNSLRMPENLHILGLMNNSDRSISYIDVAIRRRFAFVDFWPNIEIVKTQGSELTLTLYRELLSIFLEFANDESITLMPGHSYFLKYPNVSELSYLKTNLIPLLKDYIQQGYVGSFSEHIHAYIQKVESL